MTTTPPDTQISQAPAIKGGVVAYLNLDGALKAAEFYKRAFGADIVHAYPPDDRGRTMHIHMIVNGSSLMMGDCFPEHGYPYEPAQGFSLVLAVDDIDAWWQRAVEAGAEVVMPVADMFWGDRYGRLRDPFGITWAMNAPKR